MAKDQRSETNPGSTGKRIEAEARIRGAREDELRYQRRAKSPGGLALVRQGEKASFQIGAFAFFLVKASFSGAHISYAQCLCRNATRPCRRLLSGKGFRPERFSSNIDEMTSAVTLGP